MTVTGPVVVKGPLIEAPLEFRLRSGGKLSGERAFAVCPKCEAPATIRHSERMTPLVKYLFAHCSNTGCGHTFKLELAFVHSLAEGNIQRPDLNLPVCPKEQVAHILPPAPAVEEADQQSMFDSS
jgi:hypothetical protein